MANVPDIFNNGQPPTEVYFIAPIENVPSILENGLLSHKRAQHHNPADIANNEVQDIRAHKVVTNPDRTALGKRELVVHRHANMYVQGYNAMMYVRRAKRNNLCVLRIDPRILSRDEVVIADKNASRGDAHFHKASTFSFSPESAEMQLQRLSYVFADRKTGKVEKRKAVLQAEVLVPYQLHPSYIRGIFVANNVGRQNLEAQLPNGCPVPVDEYPSLFFPSNVKTHLGYNPLENIQAQPLANAAHPDLVEDLAESSDEEVFPMDLGFENDND